MGFNLFLNFISVFIFGLAAGSFLNCVIYRLGVDESSLKGRSFCPHCKHLLSWQDLVPVLSFVFLKGKCRYCRQRISWQYPLVELGTAILFILILNKNMALWLYGSTALEFLNLSFLLLASCFLIIIFVYDLKHYLILDKVVYPAIIATFLYNSIFNWLYGSTALWLYGLISAFGAAIFFLSIVLISRGKWMGVGDIKLAFLMGLILGFPNILVALFLAFLFGAIIGIGLIIFSKKRLSSEVPFGPFLVAGTFAALFWGQAITDWYLQLLIS